MNNYMEGDKMKALKMFGKFLMMGGWLVMLALGLGLYIAWIKYFGA